jgi:hypothetical protein
MGLDVSIDLDDLRLTGRETRASPASVESTLLTSPIKQQVKKLEVWMM